jgi:hypothetical protein
MAIAMIVPLARERMIKAAARQRSVCGQQFDNLIEGTVETPAVLTFLLTFIVAPEACGRLNRPH